MSKRDGVYQQTITLDAWNQTQNGAKTITISAMDFWSNTASTVLNITLDNPLPILDAQPRHDDFSLGDGWQEMASTTVPTDAAQIRLGNGSIGASMGFTTYFDDFLINSGVTTYRP